MINLINFQDFLTVYNNKIYEESGWARNIKGNPGSVRKLLKVKEGEKIKPSQIEKKLKELKAKREKRGKYTPKELKQVRQLNVAKTFLKWNNNKKKKNAKKRY
jgi:hypothetical protein